MSYVNGKLKQTIQQSKMRKWRINLNAAFLRFLWPLYCLPCYELRKSCRKRTMTFLYLRVKYTLIRLRASRETQIPCIAFLLNYSQ